MIALVDTNVVLDVMLGREPHLSDSAAVLAAVVASLVVLQIQSAAAEDPTTTTTASPPVRPETVQRKFST